MKDTDSVDKYVLEFRNWRAKMISAGFNLEEDLVAVILLIILSDIWISVVQYL